MTWCSAELLRQRGGELAALHRLLVVAQVGGDARTERLSLGPQHGALVTDELEGLGAGGLGLGVEPGVERGVADRQEQTYAVLGRRIGTELFEVVAQQREGAVEVAGREHGIGSSDDEPDEVSALGGGVDHLQGVLVVVGALVVASNAYGILGRLDVGGEGASQVTGGRGVHRDLGGGPLRSVSGQRADVGEVDAAPLARQQVVVNSLGEQRVAEPVGVSGHLGEHLVVDRGPQGVVELRRRKADHGSEDLVGDAAARARRGAYDEAGVVVESVEPDEEQVGESLGQGRLDVGEAGVDELLGVERVAGGAAYDRLDAFIGEVTGTASRDERAYVGVRQRAQLDAAHAREAYPLGDGLAQRVATVQVVGAIAHDDVHGLAEGVGEDVADQVTGGAVCPVDVFDDEQDRAVRGQVVEAGDDRREELGAVDLVGLVDGLAGQQRCEGGKSDGQLVALGLVEDVERLDEGLERQVAVAEVEAVPDEHTMTGGVGAIDELAEESGLADAGVSTEEDGVTAAAVGDAGRGEQLLELGGSPDQRIDGTPVGGHAPHDAGVNRLFVSRASRHESRTRDASQRSCSEPRTRTLGSSLRQGVHWVSDGVGRRVSTSRRRWRSARTNASGWRIMLRSSPSEVGPHIGRNP